MNPQPHQGPTNVAALVGAGALLAAGVLSGPRDLLRTAIPIVGGLIAATAVLLIPLLTRDSSRHGGASWFADLVDGIDGARHTLLSASWRLIGAVGYLALDIAALGASFAATGHPVPVAPLVLGYLIGYLANLIPVPGGFGVLEGGLAGALIAYGAPVTQATAAVIVYPSGSLPPPTWWRNRLSLFNYLAMLPRKPYECGESPVSPLP